MNRIHETDSGPERAFLAGVIVGAVKEEQDAGLDELASLARTAGLDVRGRLIQRRHRPHPGTCFGKGKLEELRATAEAAKAELLITDNNLAPAQLRFLEELTGLRVLDRTELILDIFARHARSQQAMWQVELAQLQYEMPRLKRLWTHLSRQKASVGMRGPGEQQLETDKRIIRRRIPELQRRLAEIQERKDRQVAARAQPLVSLVGYTNAGKSSLINALTRADALVADKLFSTLDTLSRAWSLGGGREVVLSDTVGFIRNLPHHLVASFHATLEEVRQADLLLHVVDASQLRPVESMQAVDRVLRFLGCEGRPVIFAFNKFDRVTDAPRVRHLMGDLPAVAVSAVTGQGLDELVARVRDFVAQRDLELELEAPAGDGRLLALIAQHGALLQQNYEGERVRLKLRASPALAQRLQHWPDTTIITP